MNQNTFLAIAAVIPFVLGLYMMLSPAAFVEMSGMPLTPHLVLMMRTLGVFNLAMAPAFWAARKDPGSPTLTGVLIGFIILNFGTTAADIQGVNLGLVNSKVYVGLVVRNLVALGAIVLLFNLSRKQS